MKFNNYSKYLAGGMFLILATLFSFQNINAQTVCSSEEACLTTLARGSVTWQMSTDTVNWSNQGTGDTLCLFMTQSAMWRAMVVEGTCDTIYSDTNMITVVNGPTANAGDDAITCSGYNFRLGSKSGVASGGLPPYSYSWSPGSGLSDSSAANPSAPITGNSTYVVTVTDSNGCTATDTVSITTGATTSSGVDTFQYAGTDTFWVVPSCVDSVRLDVWGAQGGNDGPSVPGGDGGYSSGWLDVNQGDTLWVYVGGKGTDGPGSGQNCNMAGGWNGGGTTGDTCCSNAGGGAGAGGGGSDIRYCGKTLNDRVIVAGGGGGSGSSDPGADGGGTTGGNGTTYNGVFATGGSQTAGGQAGGFYTAHTCSRPTVGTFGQGGKGDGNDGGGGGGGWYGGGGGSNNGSGAGGSGYIGGVTGGSMTSGVRAGNGLIVITW